MNDYQNYIQIKGRTGIIRNKTDFVYVDIPGSEESAPYADRLFMQNNYGWVKFKGDFAHDDHEFMIVWCRIPTKHIAEFKTVMEQLKTGIPVLGYPKYKEFCENTFTKMIGNGDIEIADQLSKCIREVL